MCIWLLPLFCVSCHLQAKKKIKFRFWEKENYAVKCITLWYKLFSPSQLGNVQRKTYHLYFGLRILKEKTQLFYVLYLNYPGVLQTEQLKYIVMKLHKGLKLHTWDAICTITQKSMEIVPVEKKINQLCGVHAVTYRSEELLLWISSCPGASWPP